MQLQATQEQENNARASTIEAGIWNTVSNNHIRDHLGEACLIIAGTTSGASSEWIEAP